MLSEHNNINQFDELFRSELSNHSVQAPQGVWEHVASQIGSGVAGTGAAAVAAKSALTLKAIIAVIAIAATVTTAVVLLNQNSGDKDIHTSAAGNTKETPQVREQDHTSVQSPVTTPVHEPSGGTPAVTHHQNQHNNGAQNNQLPNNPNVGNNGMVYQTPSNNNGQTFTPPTQTSAIQTSDQGVRTSTTPEKPATPAAGNANCKDGRKASARFTCKEEEEGKFTFIPANQSQAFTWNFDDNSEISTGKRPVHVFYPDERNTYTVMAIATNDYGCKDTFRQKITNHNFSKEENPKCPNVFTPDGDGINDEYIVLISGEEAFNLRIFDKENKLVFETSDKTTGWNGYLKDGSKAAYGTYYFVLNYKLGGRNAQKKNGTILVMPK